LYLAAKAVRTGSKKMCSYTEVVTGYHLSHVKNGTANTQRPAKGRARFPITFAVNTKGPQ